MSYLWLLDSFFSFFFFFNLPWSLSCSCVYWILSSIVIAFMRMRELAALLLFGLWGRVFSVMVCVLITHSVIEQNSPQSLCYDM